MQFERTTRRKLISLNLTPLIDILFILIIFFMLTTSFMRIESMELILPSAAGKSAEKQEAMHLFVQANGELLLGSRKVTQDEMTEILSWLLEKDPSLRIMVLTDDGVTMQQLVNVMDRVYMLGGKSLFVRKWKKKG